jgi:hypothetical protein
MRYLFLIFLVISLSGCTSKYHLKRAQHHIEKAKKKDPSVKGVVDTVYKQVIVTVPSVKIDTIVRVTTDTLTIENERVVIRTVKLPGDLQYIEVECKERKVIVEVPCEQITIIRTESFIDYIKRKLNVPKPLLWLIIIFIIFLLSFHFFNRLKV